MSGLGALVVEELLAAMERDPATKDRVRKALGIAPPPEPKPEVLYMPLTDWAKRAGIGRSKAFELAKEPGFPIVLSGRARRVDVKAAEQWIRARHVRKTAA